MPVVSKVEKKSRASTNDNKENAIMPLQMALYLFS
jgi:hypothetical protein